MKHDDIISTLSLYCYSTSIRRILHIMGNNSAYLFAISRQSQNKRRIIFRIIRIDDEYIIYSDGNYYFYYYRDYLILFMIYIRKHAIVINVHHDKPISYLDHNRKLLVDWYNSGELRRIVSEYIMREYTRNGAIICERCCYLEIHEIANIIHINIVDHGRIKIYDKYGRVIKIYHKYDKKKMGSCWDIDYSNRKIRYSRY